MQSINELLNSYKDLRTLNYPIKDLAEKVVTQATRHCTRSDMVELYDIARPNEEEIFKKWRQDNLRHITVAPILDFKLMLVRVLQSSLEEIKTDEFPELKELVYDNLLTLSLYDTNATVIDWPYNPDRPTLAPSTPVEQGGRAENMEIASETTIIASDKIRVFNNSIFVWYLGKINIGTEKDPENVDYYGALDKQNYYILYPRKLEKEISYYSVIWYNHALNRLPVAMLPGFNIFDKTANEYYKESICWGAYEYLDEAVIALSSDQVTRIRHSQPKLVINADLTCPTCNGKAIEEIKGEKIPCRTCNGTGSLQNIGDFATIKVRQKQGNFDSAGGNPVYYVQAPGNIEYTKSVWQELVSLAEKELCTDLLEGTGNESGIAKELRLEPRQDLLRMFGEQFIQMIEDVYNNHMGLIKPGSEPIDLVVPTYYQSKSPEILALEMQDSLPGERYLKYLNLIKAKYRGNEKMINVHTIAPLYAPLMLYKPDEIPVAINLGSYSERDIIKRDYAVFAISNVLEDKAELTPENMSEVFEKADEVLIKMSILPKPATGMEFDEQTRSKLLDTVGGADAAININKAVSEGIMSETAAEKLLAKFFKISIEEARELIDLPQNRVQNLNTEAIDIKGNTTVEQLPDNLDELEEVLTAFVNEEIDRETTIKLVMVIEKIDEAEAIEIIDNME